MDEKSKALKSLLQRFVLSLPFFVTGAILILPIGLLSIPGVLLLMIGGYCLVRPIAELISLSSGALIFPSSGSREVNLMFSIPETRVMEGKYEEALQLYRNMIPQDPKRLEIYVRIMKLGAREMEQPELVSKTFREGLKNLVDLQDRKILAYEYKELMSSLRNS